MTGFTLQWLLQSSGRGSRSRAALGLILALCGATFVAPAGARAQQAAGPSEPTAADYDAIVLQALAAYDAGRWDEARRLFEWAHGLSPTARTLRTIGMSAFNQGDYVGALQNLEAALVDPRKPLTDEQRVHAAELIERANLQVGRYSLRIVPAGARLLVDGKSPVLIGEDQLVLTPGAHDLVVRAEGYPPLSRHLQVKARDRSVLELRLAPEGSVAEATSAPATPAAQAAAAATPAQPDPAASDSDGTRVALGVVSLSLGAAGLIASGVTAALALSEKSSLDDHCPERRCPSDQFERVDRYDGLRLASGLSLIGGVVFAGVGAYLLLSGDDDHEHVHAVVGPGFAGIAGRL